MLDPIGSSSVIASETAQAHSAVSSAKPPANPQDKVQLSSQALSAAM
jgi:hypothetical protein